MRSNIPARRGHCDAPITVPIRYRNALRYAVATEKVSRYGYSAGPFLMQG
jgi:hypothetical protein